MRHPTRFGWLAALAGFQWYLLHDIPLTSWTATLPAVFFLLSLAKLLCPRPTRLEVPWRMAFAGLTGYSMLLLFELALDGQGALSALAVVTRYYWPAFSLRAALGDALPRQPMPFQAVAG